MFELDKLPRPHYNFGMIIDLSQSLRHPTSRRLDLETLPKGLELGSLSVNASTAQPISPQDRIHKLDVTGLSGAFQQLGPPGPHAPSPFSQGELEAAKATIRRQGEEIRRLTRQLAESRQSSDEYKRVIDEFKSREAKLTQALKELVEGRDTDERIQKLQALLRVTSEELEKAQREIARQKSVIEELNKKLARPRKTSRNSHNRPSEDIGKGKPFKKKNADKAAAAAPEANEAEVDDPKAGVADTNGHDVDGAALNAAAAADGDSGGSTPEKGDAVRKIGGQPGHKGHFHVPFAEWHDLILHDPPEGDVCKCGVKMVELESGQKRQDVYELPPEAVLKHVHLAKAYECPECHRIHEARLPGEVIRHGVVGPNLTAYIVMLNVVGHMSLAGISEVLRNMGVTLPESTIHTVLRRSAEAFDPAYRELLDELRKEPVVNIDETTIPENGSRLYVWGFNAAEYTAYTIGTREADNIVKVLGTDFEGVIGCDYYVCYRSYFKINRKAEPAFCHAHLTRDLRFLAEHDIKFEPELVAFGKDMLEAQSELLSLWKEYSASPSDELHERVRMAGDKLRSTALRAPPIKEAQAIAKRFQDYWDGYTKFIDTTGVAPSNNVAERAFRFVAIARKISQGTRSERGRWVRVRLWSVFSTCRRQNRSFFEYTLNAFKSWCKRETAPSLLH